MAITHSILNLDTATVDVAAIVVPTMAQYALVDTKLLDPGRESLYQKVGGNEEYPLTVRVGHYPKKGSDGVGQVNISVKISTFVETVDDVSGETLRVLPCSMTLAWSVPGTSGVPDEADLMALICMPLTWVLPVASGAFTGDALDELKFGVVNQLVAHQSS
jgi:hypothetical protein